MLRADGLIGLVRVRLPQVLIPVILLGAPGCTGGAGPSSRPALTLFAASSTTDAVDTVVQQFESDTGHEVVTSFAASSTLARQIEQGADADLFLSANEEWADYLEQLGLVDQRRELLSNRLVVIVPATAESPPLRPDDLKAETIEHIAIGDPEGVPAGIYAKEALTNLDLWDALAAKIVPAGNVRQALLYVERGETEAGIVYATDAALTEKVRIAFEFDSALTGPVAYPLLLLRGAESHPEATALFRYLSGREAATVFRDYGFTVLDNGAEANTP